MKLLCIYLEKSRQNNDESNILIKTYPIHTQEYEEIQNHINNENNSIKISYLKTMHSLFMNKLYPDILSQDNNESSLVSMYLIYDDFSKEYSFALSDAKL